MSLRFDATLKDLAEDNPAAFVTAFDELPAGPVAMLNVDLSTVTAAADLVFGIGDPLTEVVHVDCQSRAQEDVNASVLRYNGLLHHRLKVPVFSVVLLLHPRAKHPKVNGMVQYGNAGRRGPMDFRYKLVHLWEQPVEEILKCPPSLLPLATLAAMPEGMQQQEALASVVNRILARLHGEVDEGRFRRLATAAFVLSGMRVPREVARSLFLGVKVMHESDTYQAILDEGRIRGVQKMLIRLGRKRFGEPDATTQQRVMAVNNADRLDQLSERLLEVGSWQHLLRE